MQSNARSKGWVSATHRIVLLRLDTEVLPAVGDVGADLEERAILAGLAGLATGLPRGDPVGERCSAVTRKLNRASTSSGAASTRARSRRSFSRWSVAVLELEEAFREALRDPVRAGDAQ